jgi:iron-sulfur cluster repair protein YtfE (RIC family)
MELSRHVCRSLHDDHVATLAILARLDTLLGHHGPSLAPTVAAPEVAPLLRDFLRVMDGEIGVHFSFEEEQVFPLLAAHGDAEMGTLLIEEHAAILPLVKRLVALGKGARDRGFTGEAWKEFHFRAAELSELLGSHVQKEEMALLPLLDDLLDDEADGRLALDLAARR